MSIKSSHLAAFVVVGSILVLGGCGTEAPEDPAGHEEAADLATQAQAVYSGWTQRTGANLPPVNCDPGSLPTAVKCSDSYCSYMQLLCEPTNAIPSNPYWTPYFSEEDPARYCNTGYMVTGLHCKGIYCDNISLECSLLAGVRSSQCQWSGWMSEESGGTLSFGTSFYIKGVQCDDSYCDNLRYYVCKIT